MKKNENMVSKKAGKQKRHTTAINDGAKEKGRFDKRTRTKENDKLKDRRS